jgi:GntR family transcriptional regulator, rspAB operon transcriptional repressor
LTIFETLRQSIISLDMKPGTVLSRLELQEKFRLSSSPIRDALMKLQSENLVDIFPQHATVVSAINLDHARQAQFMRRALEVEIVRKLADHCDGDVMSALKQLIRRQKAYQSIDDYQSFMTADQSFHQTMYIAAKVPDLWNLLRQQSGHIDRLRRLHLPALGKMTSIIEDHEEVLAAIEAGDTMRAETALRGHLSRSLESAESLKEKFPEYF